MFTKTIFLFALAITLTSCISFKSVKNSDSDTPVVTKNTSAIPLNACPNVPASEEVSFPPYSGFMKQIMDGMGPITSSLTNSLEMREPTIGFINSLSLQKKILARNGNTVIIIWSSYYCDSELDFIELNRLFSDKKYDIYVICTDLGSENQFRLIKKYYESKKFFDKSYFLYFSLDNPFKLKSELENRYQITQFIKDVIPTGTSEHLPYIVLADKEQNILYGNYNSKLQVDTIDYIFQNPEKYRTNNKLFQHYKPSKEDLELLAGNSSQANNNTSVSEVSAEDISSVDRVYQMSTLVLGVDEKDVDKVKESRIFTLSIDSLKQMLANDKKKKLVHFWGGWCPATTYEMDEFAKLMPKNNEYSTYFISVDCNNLLQRNLLRTYYNKLKINCDAFIIENVINNQEEWMPNLMKVQIDYLKTIDKNVSEFILPYTAVLDQNNNLLYWRGFMGPKTLEEMAMDKETYLGKNAKNDFELIKELLGK